MHARVVMIMRTVESTYMHSVVVRTYIHVRNVLKLFFLAGVSSTTTTGTSISTGGTRIKVPSWLCLQEILQVILAEVIAVGPQLHESLSFALGLIGRAASPESIAIGFTNWHNFLLTHTNSSAACPTVGSYCQSL